jgi:hypothetical protein
MAWWKISTKEKKSCEEREIWTKDGKKIVRINGFRWGTFMVETTDDNPPDGVTAENPDGINMYDLTGDNINQVELESMDDGWYGDYEFEGFDDDEEYQDEVIEGMEEDYYDYLESNDWYNDETQAWLFGPLEIEKEQDE